MYLHGFSLREDGANLAASRIDTNFDFSTGLVENALALNLFAMSSCIGRSPFAVLVIIIIVGGGVSSSKLLKGKYHSKGRTFISKLIIPKLRKNYYYV
jgi:hypothetical protein